MIISAYNNILKGEKMKNLIKAKTKEELADKIKILHGKEIDINFVEDDPVPLKEGKKLLEKLGPKTALQITTARNDEFENIIKRIERKKENKKHFLSKHNLNERISKYVTCKGCGSKIATSKLKKGEHKCPVCKNGELYSKTLSEKIKKYNEQIRELEIIRDKITENNKEKIEWIIYI